MKPQEIFNALMSQEEVIYNNLKYTIYSMEMDHVTLYNKEQDELIYDITFNSIKTLT